MAPELIQIIYKDEQRASCYPFSRLYFNEGLSIFFENKPISELVMASNAEKIGVCSWKLREKMRMNVCRPRELTEEVINSDYDVLSFTCNTKYHKMLSAADQWHKGFREAINKIVEIIGSKAPGEVRHPIYQNAFMAKREIYQDYVRNWLIPAMDAINNIHEINVLALADSNYSNLAKKDAVDRDYLMDKIGVPFYPLAPFILERLFSVYVHNNRINPTWL